MVESGGEMERGNRSRLQHHKKQGCFGIKILAIRCQNELPEKRPHLVFKESPKKKVNGGLYFCRSCILDGCIFVSAVS